MNHRILGEATMEKVTIFLEPAVVLFYTRIAKAQE